jgi:hypothetical protein
MPGVEGHVLDEAHVEVALPRKRREVHHLVHVHPAYHHGVDPDRTQTCGRGRLQAPQHLREPIAPGDLVEALGPHRIHRYVDAAQAGLRQRLSFLGEPPQPTRMPTRRTISAKLKILSRGSHSSPSWGMQ